MSPPTPGIGTGLERTQLSPAKCQRVGTKFPSYKFGSAGALALQGIAIRKVLILISTELTFADLC